MKIERKSDHFVIEDNQFIVFDFKGIYHLIDYDRDFDRSLIDYESFRDMIILKSELNIFDLLDFVDLYNEIERLRKKSGPLFDSDLDSIYDDLLNERCHRSIQIDLDHLEVRIDRSRNSDSEFDILNREFVSMNRMMDYLRSEIKSLKS